MAGCNVQAGMQHNKHAVTNAHNLKNPTPYASQNEIISQMYRKGDTSEHAARVLAVTSAEIEILKTLMRRFRHTEQRKKGKGCKTRKRQFNRRHTYQALDSGQMSV